MTSMTKALKTCRNALFLTDPSIDRDSVIRAKGDRVKGTCEWILKNETFKSWLTGDLNLLWLRGGPGKGKTMMSVFLTQELALYDRCNLTYYFCNGQDERRSSATAILRTLLWQITGHQRGLIQHILPLFDPPERGQATLASEETLWQLLIDVGRKLEDKRVHCIIDGMDECDEDSALWLASKLAIFRSQDDNPSLNIMILSRDITALEGSTCMRLDPDNSKYVSADVEMYVRTQVQQLSQQLHFSPQFTEHVVDILLEKSEGTFLWVGFVMAELSKKRTSTQVRSAVYNLPKGLPAYYARMLERIQPENRRKSVLLLSWVTMSFRKALSLKTFADILECHASEGIDEEQATLDEVSACAPMIIVRDGGISFVHQSAKDYLLRPGPDANAVLEEFRIKPEEAHLNIAMRSLEALASGTYLQYYALLNWPKHARCLNALASALIQKADFFFAKDSSVRDEWWGKYSMNFKGLPVVAPPPLHIACHLGFEAWMWSILREKGEAGGGFDLYLDEECPSGWTPVDYAAESESNETLQLLLRNQASEKICSSLRMPLGRAILAGRAAKTVRRLLVAGADPHSPLDDGRCPMTLAIEREQHTTIRALQDHGVDIGNLNHTKGNTSLVSKLHEAPRQNLKRRRSSHDAVDEREGEADALSHLRTSTVVDTASRIIQDAAQRRLLRDIDNGDVVAVEMYFFMGDDDEKYNGDRFNKWRVSPVFLAACHLNGMIMGTLVRHGINLDAIGLYGEPDLHRVISFSTMKGGTIEDHWTGKDYELLISRVRLLLYYKANVNAMDLKGVTPLHLAVYRYRQLDASAQRLSSLLDCRSILLARDQGGHPAIDLRQLFVEELLHSGANPNLRDAHGATVLHYTVIACNDLMTDWFEGKWTHTQDTSRRPRCMNHDWNRYQAQVNLVSFLVAHGADVDIKDNLGMTAFQHSHHQLVKDDMRRVMYGRAHSLRRRHTLQTLRGGLNDRIRLRYRSRSYDLLRTRDVDCCDQSQPRP
ncbi:hypothetical protein Q7P37_007755 [Cladosporium fusiforme]